MFEETLYVTSLKLSGELVVYEVSLLEGEGGQGGLNLVLIKTQLFSKILKNANFDFKNVSVVINVSIQGFQTILGHFSIQTYFKTCF